MAVHVRHHYEISQPFTYKYLSGKKWSKPLIVKTDFLDN